VLLFASHSMRVSIPYASDGGNSSNCAQWRNFEPEHRAIFPFHVHTKLLNLSVWRACTKVDRAFL